MPTLVLSTYLDDYISPAVRHAQHARRLHALKPPDFLPIDAGRRLLPTTFKQVYQNCVSASIGDRLELQFTDDTPQWKRTSRAASAAWWIRPLEERRQFIETQGMNRRGGASGNSESAGDSRNVVSVEYQNADGGIGGDVAMGENGMTLDEMIASEIPGSNGQMSTCMMMPNGGGVGSAEVSADAVNAQAMAGGMGMFAVGAGNEIGNIPSGNYGPG